MSSPSELSGEWIIARVKGNQERKLIWLLTTYWAPGIGYCLPMERVQRQDEAKRNRGFYSRLVFPGHLFVCCRHEDDFYSLVSRGPEGILGRIRVTYQQQFVKEMSGFHIAAENQMLKLGRATGIRKGVKCEITKGSMRGHQGWIESVEDGKQEVVIKLTILGQSTPTTISIDDVEPVN